MSIDPRRLRPGELVKLLNSTRLGEVTTERQLHRHRTRAGFRVTAEGDTGRVDLYRYVAWLVAIRHDQAAGSEGETGVRSAYEAHKESVRKRDKLLSVSGRDIGVLPAVVDPKRRARAERDFRFFCETYFPRTFGLKWSPDHLRVIAKIERAVLLGELFAIAMPRGSGKSSLCEVAGIWALIFGHCEFAALIGADEGHAESMLDSIKTEFETNDGLFEDFPEICVPIRALGGINQRAAGQLYKGKQTRIGWKNDEIVLPTIEGSKASGAVMRVAGLTGAIRGMKHKRADGVSIRPSLAIIDDPQTDESARSPTQCADRERILSGAILGLAGPGKKIAGLMTLTVVRGDDMADRMLDRDKHPHWQGERTKMVYAWPENEDLWDKYGVLLNEGLKANRGIGEATAFYRRHKAKMDEGAEVAWAERYNPDELSAVQHAMNLRLRDERSFFAEYQNEPLPENPENAVITLSASQVAEKINGFERGVIPDGAVHLTAFIDCGDKVLHWCVAAWASDFTGWVIDHGMYPDQGGAAVTSTRKVVRTLEDESKGASSEAAVYAGLMKLTDKLLGREWKRAAGGTQRIERCLIDSGWIGDTVRAACQASPHAAVLMASRGRFFGPAQVPMEDFPKRPGEIIGHRWHIPTPARGRSGRTIAYDSNYWKSFINSRLASRPAEIGSLSLFGRKPAVHTAFAEQVCGEFATRTTGQGRTVDIWQPRPGRENHWLDTLVGCAVAASRSGAALPGLTMNVAHRKRIKLSDLRGRPKDRNHTKDALPWTG